MKIDALRTEEMEQGDIDPVGNQGENADIQKTTGIETEYTEEKNDNVDQQQDAAGLIGKIHSIHYHKDGNTHLDGRQTGIGHLQIEAGADDDIEDNVRGGNDDQESGNRLPFHEPRQIGNITKTTTEDIGGKRHQQTADAQSLLPITLGEDGKMDKLEKDFLFHSVSIRRRIL